MVELIGKVFMCIGGIPLCFFLLVIMAEFVAQVWIRASNKQRDICNKESLIHEYRRNRKDYLFWKDAQNKDDGGTE